MRVISGKYKGLKLNGFDINGTRPTMDRVKESLFASIYPYLDNAIILDLFAGSGALGIEALSNGAKEIYLVDNNKVAIDIINKNINNMNENIHVIKSDAFKALETFETKKFDIIFLDPPYKEKLINKAIELIVKLDLLNDNGIIVCEYENENIMCDLKLIKEKKYGFKRIKIFKK